jgi:hypothetical protein
MISKYTLFLAGKLRFEVDSFDDCSSETVHHWQALSQKEKDHRANKYHSKYDLIFDVIRDDVNFLVEGIG